MEMDRRAVLGAGALLAGAGTGAAEAQGRGATPPALVPAFSVVATVGAPMDLGTVGGVRKRLVPITGGPSSPGMWSSACRGSRCDQCGGWGVGAGGGAHVERRVVQGVRPRASARLRSNYRGSA